MIHFKLILDCSKSALAVGGYSLPQKGFHSIQAHDDRGIPYVPSTALRGALRMSLEALLRATSHGACHSGKGDPETGTCTAGKGGKRCIACEIFGGSRTSLSQSELRFSALVLDDALLAEHVSVPVWSLRHSVGLSRARRSAEENHLFNRLTTAPRQDLIFCARGSLSPLGLQDGEKNNQTTQEDHLRFLCAAARATKHIGSGRSRGLGRVDISIEQEDSPQISIENTEIQSSNPSSEIRLRVTLGAPTSIGLPNEENDQRDTRFDIPGSAMRGALGFAIAEFVPDPDRHKDFQELVHEQNGAIFDFLYPVSPAYDKSTSLPGPYPQTVATCKHKPFVSAREPGHGLHNTILDRIAIELAERNQRQVPETGSSLTIHTCPHPECGAPLEALSSQWRRQDEPPKITMATRVRLNRCIDGAEEGDLFTETFLKPGQVFETTIREIPEAGFAFIKQALHTSRLALGRGKSRGLGKIDVEIVSPQEMPSLESRVASFDAAIEKRLSELGLRLPEGRLICLTLHSPMLLPNPAADELELFSLALGLGKDQMEILHLCRRFGYERGWSQRGPEAKDMGVRKPYYSVLAGGVYVLLLRDSSLHWREALVRLEREGIGDRCRMGYGRVFAFDLPLIKGVADETK